MAPDLRVAGATLTAAQSTLSKAANQLEPLQRTLNGQDAGVVGADPLTERLHAAQGNLAGGIGILGQALASLATYVVDAGTSYGSTDGSLAGQVPRGAR
jgi:hypothetical protein